MTMPVYLDGNATAPIRPEAAEATLGALRVGGNPSSVHAAGRAARAVLEAARERVAALAGARPADVTFTSGGLRGQRPGHPERRPRRDPAPDPRRHGTRQRHGGRPGQRPARRPVAGDALGVAELGWLKDRLAAWDTKDGPPFVALMLANNETGVVQPVAEAAALVHDAGGWLHVDAVQAAGRIPIDIAALGADTLTLSAHKLGGPQGSGALAQRPAAEVTRSLFGGGQERGRRGGTENLSGAAGFGAAARLALAELTRDQTAWRDAAAERLKAEAGVVVLGEGAPRIPNTLCFAAEGYSSELQVMAMDLAGVMISAGSACSSGKVKASHVVTAMGRPDLAACAIRVSGGWATTKDDWDRFADAWLESHARRSSRARTLVEA